MAIAGEAQWKATPPQLQEEAIRRAMQDALVAEEVEGIKAKYYTREVTKGPGDEIIEEKYTLLQGDPIEGGKGEPIVLEAITPPAVEALEELVSVGDARAAKINPLLEVLSAKDTKGEYKYRRVNEKGETTGFKFQKDRDVAKETVEEAQKYILRELRAITYKKQDVTMLTYTLLTFSYQVESAGIFSLPVVDTALKFLEGHLRRMHEPEMNAKIAELNQISKSLRSLPRDRVEERLNLVQRLAGHMNVSPDYWNKALQQEESFDTILTNIATSGNMKYVEEALRGMLPEELMKGKPFTPQSILEDFKKLEGFSELPEMSDVEAKKLIDEHLLFHGDRDWTDGILVMLALSGLLMQLFQQAAGAGLEVEQGHGAPPG